ncbi:GTP cyclohydrolase-2 [Nannizzia gypsea CBS 118893]|uniref:GTP cyclohydrolase II n=1 Tax=Arthroderma gypseum (strain ATCC MYA-4604 / CBS 118893) TaxID=535722 RepID=E4USG9_ARTGP|nr:GTP cyclohydrolase-2 [Nannizzia gypsea CBS 118893]EFR00536.1 GTP cyclohydrolase-2 [Nannizzia gypsea CBS 118893]
MPSPSTHASPFIAPRPFRPHVTEYSLTQETAPNPKSIPLPSMAYAGDRGSDGNRIDADAYTTPNGATTPALPPSIISPALSPSSTPISAPDGTSTSPDTGSVYPAILTPRTGSADQRTHSKPPRLLPRLPKVECIVRARIPTTSGAEMFLHLYQNDVDNKEHLAIVFGNSIRSRSLDRVRDGETEMDRMIRGAYVGRLRPGRQSSRYDEATPSSIDTRRPSQAPLVRIHSECYTGETAWSARCDCGEQLDEAARLMSEPTPAPAPATGEDTNAAEPGGVIVYLRQEGRGIGLGEKLKAYNLQDLGSDTVEANLLLRHPADARSYGLATAILVDLGLGQDSSNGGIRLLTNNPDKVAAIEGPNREVVVQERVPMVPLAWKTGGAKGIKSVEIEGYLRTKIGKMGHMLE